MVSAKDLIPGVYAGQVEQGDLVLYLISEAEKVTPAADPSKPLPNSGMQFAIPQETN